VSFAFIQSGNIIPPKKTNIFLIVPYRNFFFHFSETTVFMSFNIKCAISILGVLSWRRLF